MTKMLCSLCKKTKNAAALDMNDPLFGTYAGLLRKAGISKHKGALGVCAGCMQAYAKLYRVYQAKSALYLVFAIVVTILYFALTGNVIISLLIGLFLFSLSLFSYCPPLKK